MGTIHPSKISGKDVQCIFVLTTDTNSSIQSLRYVKRRFFFFFLLLRKVLFLNNSSGSTSELQYPSILFLPSYIHFTFHASRKNIYSTFHNIKIYYKSAEIFTSNVLLSICNIFVSIQRLTGQTHLYLSVKKNPRLLAY